METILDHIRNLDRMIEAGNTPIDKLRSQLAFIGREVAALQADYSALNQAHSDFYAGFEDRIAKLQERDKKAMRDYFDEQHKKAAEIRKGRTLNYT